MRESNFRDFTISDLEDIEKICIENTETGERIHLRYNELFDLEEAIRQFEKTKTGKEEIRVDWECDNNACNFYKGGNVAPFGKQGICHKCARKRTGERI